jgi:glycerol-3-phosphate dehydrogenase (NAD(P)+)
MIAEELRAGRPGFADVGTPDPDVFRRVGALFDGTPLHLRHCTDVTGISWAAVLKNVYVPLLGAAEEAGLGDNTRGCLAAAALEEMGAIVGAMGGRRATVSGLAGTGDLVTTATSAGSYHRRVGRDLEHCAPGDTCGTGVNVHSEGIHTLAIIERHGLLDVQSFPLLRLVRDLVHEPRDVALKIRPFLAARFGHVGPSGNRA